VRQRELSLSSVWLWWVASIEAAVVRGDLDCVDSVQAVPVRWLPHPALVAA
jgi:hypothetical protein